jgi:hypothetical protein
MPTFVSLVGRSPGAVASALSSWLHTHPGTIDRAVLLGTPETSGIDDRIRDWARLTHDIECTPFTGSSGSTAAMFPDEVFAEWRRGRRGVGDVVYNVAAGLNWQVARMCRVMPGSTRFIAPMADALIEVVHEPTAQWTASALVSIGLRELLTLWGGEGCLTHAAPHPTPEVAELLRRANFRPTADVSYDVRIQVTPTQVHTFDLAFEAQGQFYGLLVHRARGHETDGDHLGVARHIAQMRNDLRGLWPHLVVVTDTPGLARRLELQNVTVVRSDTRTIRTGMLKQWADGAFAWEIITGRPRPVGLGPPPPAPAGEVRAGAGRAVPGRRLCVCLGNDPSATLVSLFTHTPEDAWVCYDVNTADVTDAVARLLGHAGYLPVGRLHLVPTDVYGRGIANVLNAAWSAPGGMIDVSPGSKLQTVELMRIEGADPWSLDGFRGQARPLDDRASPRPLHGPDIVTQATICGGPLTVTCARPAADLATAGGREFYPRALDHLLRVAAVRPGDEWGVRTLTTRRSLQAGHATLRHTGPRVWIEEGTRSVARPGAYMKDDWGDLLEEVVAWAFHTAGADEVRLGVRWRHPDGAVAGSDEEPHRDEIDVVARFAHRFVAVECKSGSVNLPATMRQHAARTHRCLGRLAIPVVLVPRAEVDRTVLPEQCLLWDLRQVAGAAALRAALDDAVRWVARRGSSA